MGAIISSFSVVYTETGGKISLLNGVLFKELSDEERNCLEDHFGLEEVKEMI